VITIREFALERFFAKHEFSARHVLGASDVEGMPMSELLALADEESGALWRDLRLGYTESPGLPLLRAEIAALYPGVSANEVLTFSGAEEAIFLTMQATLGPGDHAVVVWPAYQSLHEVARWLGADVSAVPLDPHGWALDFDRLTSAIRPNTRLVVVNFPHSPTGAQIDLAQLTDIVRLCADRGIRLFSDEVYRLLEHDRSAPLPAAVTLDDRAVSLGVMSKAYGLAGLRIGWIATRDATLRQRLAALKDYTTICGSAPSEILAVIALRAADRILARSHRIVGANLAVLADFMRRHSEHIAWVPPRAGSVCFPRFVRDVDAEHIAERLIDRTGVVILPGSRFEYDPAYFRLGYGRTDFSAALDLFEAELPELLS
jgi:aspartate/methionine/tyrosine aminotransferase